MPYKIRLISKLIRIVNQFRWEKFKELKILFKILCKWELISTQMGLDNQNSSIRYKDWSFLTVEKSKEMIKPSKKSTSMGLIHRKIYNWLWINRGT